MRKYLREAEVTYRRSSELPIEVRRRVRSSADVAPLVQELIGTRVTESFVVLALSVKNEVIGYHEVARGAVSSCPVVAADVFRFPLIVGAGAIIVAHNHPSGDCSPSDEDVAITRTLRDASKVLGVALLDHLIVTDRGFFSFLDAGLLGAG